MRNRVSDSDVREKRCDSSHAATDQQEDRETYLCV